jgi:hypothetical protein
MLANLSQAHVARTCARTGVELVENHPFFAPSINALDPNRLHAPDNVQVVCAGYGRARSHYDMTAFDAMLHGCLDFGFR